MYLRLQHRIFLPMAALAIALTAAVSLVAVSVTSSSLSAHIRRDVADATEAVSRSGFAVNPAILSTVKLVTGAEVVTFDLDGAVVTTLDSEIRDEVVERVRAGAQRLEFGGGAPVEAELEGDPLYYAAYKKVDDRPDTFVALLHDNSEIDAAHRMLTRTILGSASLSLVLMLVASQIIARRVTQPISQLVRFADNVSSPGADSRAPDGEDEVGRLGGAFNDMLERLEQAQASSVRSEKLALAGLFAARVAHDVRNPLSSMKMQAQLLQADAAPGSDVHSMAEAMLMDIGQVEFVVTNLLDLARPAAMRKTPQDVNALLDGVLRQITPQCEHRHLSIVRDLATDMPAVQADGDRMTQALLNLVMNAVEALREHGTLTVRSRLSPDRRSVIILIEDDGVGVDVATGQSLFDPFVSTKPDGVGLGLVNARAAIESHGGTIALTPREPSGACATVQLPVVDVGDAASGDLGEGV